MRKEEEYVANVEDPPAHRLAERRTRRKAMAALLRACWRGLKGAPVTAKGSALTIGKRRTPLGLLPSFVGLASWPLRASTSERSLRSIWNPSSCAFFQISWTVRESVVPASANVPPLAGLAAISSVLPRSIVG